MPRTTARLMPFLRLTLPNQPEPIGQILEGNRITIGRAADNTIQILDRSVSAHHAELILVQGTYRLHDLDSTNLSCVDGQPVKDFHLHVPCRIRFGNVAADFSPEVPADLGEFRNPPAPSKSEVEFLKRDNRDLQDKVAALQRQLEILGAATLQAADMEDSSVPVQIYRRAVGERDTLLRENGALKRDAANFLRDFDAILRDRDALRQALATAKADLDGVTV